MKLYELAAEYRQFEDHLEDFIDMIEKGEMDEQAFEDTLASIHAELEDKLDAVACAVKNLEAEADAMDAEEKRLKKRRAAKENAAGRLRAYIASAMQAVSMNKMESSRNRLSFLRSSKVELTDEHAFIAWAKEHDAGLLTFKEPTVNRTEIKAALNRGEVLPGARIVVGQNLQIK